MQTTLNQSCYGIQKVEWKLVPESQMSDSWRGERVVRKEWKREWFAFFSKHEDHMGSPTSTNCVYGHQMVTVNRGPVVTLIRGCRSRRWMHSNATSTSWTKKAVLFFVVIRELQGHWGTAKWAEFTNRFLSFLWPDFYFWWWGTITTDGNDECHMLSCGTSKKVQKESCCWIARMVVTTQHAILYRN